MKTKWLVAFAILLILLCWTPAFAGPKDQAGHGDDDIPELVKPKTWHTSEKLLGTGDAGAWWNFIFSVDRKIEQKPSETLDSKSVCIPATRRFPARLK